MDVKSYWQFFPLKDNFSLVCWLELPILDGTASSLQSLSPCNVSTNYLFLISNTSVASDTGQIVG